MPIRDVAQPGSALRSGRRGRGARSAINPHKKFGRMLFVYILYSEVRKKYYVGQTNEIHQRLQRHNSAKVKSTKTGVPWNLIKVIQVTSRSEAMSLEERIKKRGIERFLIDLQYPQNRKNS